MQILCNFLATSLIIDRFFDIFLNLISGDWVFFDIGYRKIDDLKFCVLIVLTISFTSLTIPYVLDDEIVIMNILDSSCS